MSWKRTQRASAAVAALILAVIGAGVAFLHLPALEGARSRIAADLLETYLGEAVVVTGSVDVAYGPTIDVAVQGVSPVTAAAGVPAPVGRVRMSFSREAALRGRLELAALDVSSVRVIMDVAAIKPSKVTLGESVSRAVEEVGSAPPPFSSYCVPLLEFVRSHHFTYPYREWPAASVRPPAPGRADTLDDLTEGASSTNGDPSPHRARS